ncbi:hypothetical protein M405DRAFT_833582 [Rhizopogon salebrosus TDB-379]|nr:hypothetical protein M405DRAFT_833582 [Rhizopogon salebrosus TDB-379]
MPAPLLAVPPSPANPLKRTSSFSHHNPSKSPRMSLRRTASFLSLSDYDGDEDLSCKSGPSSFPIYTKSQPTIVPYHRTIYHYKEQRDRRKALINRSRPEFTITPHSTKQPAKSTLPAPRSLQPPKQIAGLRTSSPLSPNKKLLPPRASFPRSKPEPDLYRIAIRARMQCSPEGAKILRMGPRMAVSILAATRELELLVSTQDVNSGDDWEMIDCGA